jgi:two-component system, NarL family, sensor histidine kinase UhpB
MVIDVRLAVLTKRGQKHRYTPLFRRVVAVNGLVLLLACVLTVLVISPGSFPSVAIDEALILVAGFAAILGVNLALLRRAFTPLEKLTDLTRKIDMARPGKRLPTTGPKSEALELGEAFNEMLARLEAEQKESTRRALSAQEAERLRTAQELHDEVGQTLTAALLVLERLAREVPADLEPKLAEAREAVRSSLEEVRRIAQQLRPEALDDLGLVSALAALSERLEQSSGLVIKSEFDKDLEPMSEEAELVVYRIAQEALTNVARHAQTNHAQLRLAKAPDRTTLSVVDTGVGFSDGDSAEGAGIRGMRERASLIGADLTVATAPSGTEVRLDVPVSSEGLWYR